MRRWEFLEKGSEFFFGAPPAPFDFYVLIDENKKLAAFCRSPEECDNRWYVLFNGQHTQRPNCYIDGELTVLEAKVEVERLCNSSSVL